MGLRYRNNLTDCEYFFVTTTVVRFLKIFTDDHTCGLLINNIKHYRERYKFDILGYVIMPSHFHWIVKINKKYGTISDIMRDVKKYSAWDIMEFLKKNKNRYENIFKTEAVKYKGQKRKFWMERFDDKVIRDEKMFRSTLQYIHYNPVKAGMILKPEDYKYSSARNYLCDDQSILEVDTSYGGI